MQLAQQKTLIIDGGLGTLLETKYKANLKTKLWSTCVLNKSPDLIYNAHKDFLEAGADIHITCTYQTFLDGFENKRDFYTSIAKAVSICKEAVNDFEKATGKKTYVAGSCGTFATGKNTFTGVYLEDLNEEEKIEYLIKFHRDRYEVLEGLACDYLAWETMPTRAEGIACSRLIAESKTPSFICFTMRDSETIANGDSLVSALEGLQLSKSLIGVGINCCDLNYVHGSIKIIKDFFADPKNSNELNPKQIVVYPNSGETYADYTWTQKDQMENTLKNFSDLAVEWRDTGATMIGGCCRVEPEVIKEIHEKFNAL